MSFRGKTLKRRGEGDISGDILSASQQQEQHRNTFLNFLDAQVENAYKRPWHRLENGLRVNRLRAFTDDEALRYSYNDMEKERLFTLLSKAHERKLLNSKNNVTYDIENQKITEIKGLVMHRNSNGESTFKILDKKASGITAKRKTAVQIEQKIDTPIGE